MIFTIYRGLANPCGVRVPQLRFSHGACIGLLCQRCSPAQESGDSHPESVDRLTGWVRWCTSDQSGARLLCKVTRGKNRWRRAPPDTTLICPLGGRTRSQATTAALLLILLVPILILVPILLLVPILILIHLILLHLHLHHHAH